MLYSTIHPELTWLSKKILIFMYELEDSKTTKWHAAGWVDFQFFHSSLSCLSNSSPSLPWERVHQVHNLVNLAVIQWKYECLGNMEFKYTCAADAGWEDIQFFHASPSLSYLSSSSPLGDGTTRPLTSLHILTFAVCMRVKKSLIKLCAWAGL